MMETRRETILQLNGKSKNSELHGKKCAFTHGGNLNRAKQGISWEAESRFLRRHIDIDVLSIFFFGVQLFSGEGIHLCFAIHLGFLQKAQM